MKCPKCGSDNIAYQREQTGNIGVGTNKIVIQKQQKSRGCLYWLIIGWWWRPCYWMFFGFWKNLFFGGKIRNGLNIHGDKIINRTMAVCQNCGHSWKV